MSQSITDILHKLDSDALDQLAEEFAEVLAAVRDRGKGGSVTLTIAIKPDADDETIIRFDPKVVGKKPPRKLDEGYLIAQENNYLARETPRSAPSEKIDNSLLDRVGRG
jgi:hypothetical protein